MNKKPINNFAFMEKIVSTACLANNGQNDLQFAGKIALRGKSPGEVRILRRLSQCLARVFLAVFLFSGVLCLTSRAADLSAGDKEFLAKYEKVRAALANDNLEDAKKAAGELGEEGAALSKSDKIATARTEFSKLSDHAIKLASGQSGYYIVNCPMVQKDWVQPTGAISNPYAGQSMPTCGAIRKPKS